MIGALGTRESCYACTPRPANLYGHSVEFSVRTTRRLLPGKRYFDDSRRGGDGIRSRFLLVFDNDANSSSKEAAEQLAGSFSEIVELRLRPGHNTTLVRQPDGYIAYSAHSRDGIAAVISVRSILERQTNSQRGRRAA